MSTPEERLAQVVQWQIRTQDQLQLAIEQAKSWQELAGHYKHLWEHAQDQLDLLQLDVEIAGMIEEQEGRGDDDQSDDGTTPET